MCRAPGKRLSKIPPEVKNHFGKKEKRLFFGYRNKSREEKYMGANVMY